MRPVTLAGDDVGNLSPSTSPTVKRVKLREGHATGVRRRVVVHDHVALERDGARRVALLLEPREAPAVAVERRHDIVPAVAVHVVHVDLGAARALRPAPATERTGWYLHSPCVAPAAGCSHQPAVWRMSGRPSPFTSPMPLEWP